jgi:hypothetical protein
VKLAKLAVDDEDSAIPEDVPPELVKAILASHRLA